MKSPRKAIKPAAKAAPKKKPARKQAAVKSPKPEAKKPQKITETPEISTQKTQPETPPQKPIIPAEKTKVLEFENQLQRTSFSSYMGDDAPKTEQSQTAKPEQPEASQTSEPVAAAESTILSEEQFYTTFKGLFFMTENITNIMLARKAGEGEKPLVLTTIQVTPKRDPDARALCSEIYKHIAKPESMFHWMVSPNSEYMALAILSANFFGGMLMDVQEEIRVQKAENVTPKANDAKKEKAA